MGNNLMAAVAGMALHYVREELANPLDVVGRRASRDMMRVAIQHGCGVSAVEARLAVSAALSHARRELEQVAFRAAVIHVLVDVVVNAPDPEMRRFAAQELAKI